MPSTRARVPARGAALRLTKLAIGTAPWLVLTLAV
jgi:hypothetical protein